MSRLSSGYATATSPLTSDRDAPIRSAMSEFLLSLRAELDHVRRSIPAREREVAQAQERLRRAIGRIEHLEALAADYEAESPLGPVNQGALPLPLDEASAALAATPAQPVDIPSPTRRPAILSKKAMMKKEIDSLLTSRGTVHRREMLSHLIAKQIMGGEENPIRALSVFLADQRDEYQSDGKGNYRLRLACPEQPPPAPNGAGSARTEIAGFGGLPP